jgi:hypothetical protein
MFVQEVFPFRGESASCYRAREALGILRMNNLVSFQILRIYESLLAVLTLMRPVRDREVLLHVLV